MIYLVCVLVAGLASTPGGLNQSAQPQPTVAEKRITLDRPASLVALSRNGDVLVTVVDGHRVDVYSALDGSRLVRLPDCEAPVYAVAISNTGKWVATGGALVTVEFDQPQKDSSIRLDPDSIGKLGGGAATKQDAKKFVYRLPAQMPIVNPRVFFSHRGGCVLVSGTKTGKTDKEFRDLPDPIVAVGFQDDEKGVVTLDRHFTYKCLSFDGPNRPATGYNKSVEINGFPSPQISFSSDGTRLASLDATNEDHGELKIKLLDSRKVGLRVIPANEVNDPWTISISGDGSRFATAGREGAISVWDFDRGRVIHTIKPPKPNDALFVRLSRDGNSVASCDHEGQIYLWRVTDGRLLYTSRVASQDIRVIEIGENHLTAISGGFRVGPDGVKPLIIQRFDLTEALRGK